MSVASINAGGDFRVGDVMSRAWNIFTGNLAFFLGITLLIYLAIFIAVGAFVATLGDTLNRFGMTDWFQLGKFLGVLFLFVGFLVSIEVFREIRIPFTSVRLGGARHESA